jgi:hypothetical protein
MPASPWNFTNLTSASPVKLFGGNITEVPNAYNGGANGYDWGEQIWSKWVTGGYLGGSTYDNWVKQQMGLIKNLGGNTVRMPGTVRTILSGAISAATVKTRYAQLFSDARSMGLTLGLNMSANNPVGYDGYSTAAWCAVVQDLWTNVFIPNQDVIAYIEPGLQESTVALGNPQPATYLQSIDILQTMQTFQTSNGYTIPLLLSDPGGNFASFVSNGANPDIWGAHYYPGTLGVTGLNWTALRDSCGISWSTVGSVKKPILVEEFGFVHGTFQDQADYYNNIFEINFGHPDIVGCMFWSVNGFDSNWLINVDPAFPGAWTTDPTVWGSSVASDAVLNWSSANRNLVYPLTLNGSQSVTSAGQVMNLNLTCRSVSAPTVTNVDIRELIFTLPYTCSVAGTFSFTGDAGTTYTMTFYANNDSTDTRSLGTTSWTGTVTNQPISISSTFPGGTEMTPVSAYRIKAQATGGSLVSGSMTALSANMVIGNAPAPASSVIPLGIIRGGLMKPSHLMLGAATIGVLRNPKLTRRRALNPLLWQ